jgi:asparagine synthase (glutamine-hydrolysing)
VVQSSLRPKDLSSRGIEVVETRRYQQQSPEAGAQATAWEPIRVVVAAAGLTSIQGQAREDDRMCGIAGILSWTVAAREREEIVRRMTASLAHRGPDGEAWITRGPCTLGFRRLAIMDLAAPAAPLTNEMRTVWSVANAEIYNAPALRADLHSRGHVFSSRLDTEVLPHLYEEEGVDLTQRLDGMFAVAIWDEMRERLLLSRDRAGEKPLFYWSGDDELVFASELRALLTHPRVERVIDPVALRRYLLHDYFPAPLTPFSGVRKLPAAHNLLALPGRIEIHRYWDLAEHFAHPDLVHRPAGDLADELDARISRAVERRRRSDVPLGVFLSGGLDSTTMLAHRADQVGSGVPAFTIGHADREFDESRFAEATGRHFGADVHTLMLGDTDLADGLRRVGGGLDEPLGDASTVPSHLLALFARQQVKVVLSGEGADELFAGYPTYLGHRLVSLVRRVPTPLHRALRAVTRLLPVSMGNVSPGYLLRRLARGLGEGLVERHHLWFGSLGPDLQTRVASTRLRESWLGDDPFASARATVADRQWPDDLALLLYTDFTMYLQDDLLTKIDRATMLASLESRAPYLDRDLMEFAAGLPSRHKVSGLTPKAILRRAARRRVPGEVLARRKRGFNIPFSRWLLHGLGEELRQRFSPDRVEARGLFSPTGVHRLLDEHLARRADHRKSLFNLLALDLWCDQVFGEATAVPLDTCPAALAVSDQRTS